MDEENIFLIWFETKNLSNSTKKVYKRYIKQYANFTGKTITELYSEALHDEKNNVYLFEREYYNNSLRFIKQLREKGKSINTVNVAITTINAFYKAFKIRAPEIEIKKGDLTQEKNYGRPLNKKDIRKMVDVANAKQTAIIYLMALSGFSQAEMRKLKLKHFLEAVNNELEYEFNTSVGSKMGYNALILLYSAILNFYNKNKTLPPYKEFREVFTNETITPTFTAWYNSMIGHGYEGYMSDVYNSAEEDYNLTNYIAMNCTDYSQKAREKAEALDYEWRYLHRICKSGTGHILGQIKGREFNDWTIIDVAAAASVGSKYPIGRSWCEDYSEQWISTEQWLMNNDGEFTK